MNSQLLKTMKKAVTEVAALVYKLTIIKNEYYGARDSRFGISQP